jgi:hypothetical protein
MKHQNIALVAMALGLLTVGPAGARPLKPEQEAQIKNAGKAVSCVQLNRIESTRVRDDSTIDFYMNGHKVYRNRLPNSCSQLGFEERFAFKTSLSELCSTDIITVLMSPGITRGASCGLGQFQPITGAPR